MDRVAVFLTCLLVVLGSTVSKVSAAETGRWQQVAITNGKGTAICNTSGSLYACMALRCGKGRGLEFAFLFNVGDYGSAPKGRISIDGLNVAELAFAAVDPKRELVAPVDQMGHAALLNQMASGGKLIFDIGYAHHFTLNNAKPEIERTLAICAGEIGEKPVVAATGGDRLERASPVSKTQSSPVPKTMLASPQTCHLKDSSAGANGPSVTVNLTTPSAEVRTGDPIAVAWNATGIDAKCRTPLYLVLTTPMRTRFAGEKFLAVPSGAPGPFGIRYQADRTRIFVPLHLGSGQQQGRVLVKAYEAGPLALDWALVEVPANVNAPETKNDFAIGRERVTAQTALGQNITVIGGNPAVVVRDQFSTDTPKQVIRSNSGEFELQIFDGYYRVFDARSGELLQERAGTDPNFSPTSRFLGAYAAGPGFELIDLYAGQVVTSGAALVQKYGFYRAVNQVAWSPGDVVFALSVTSSGGIQVQQSLLDDAQVSLQTASRPFPGSETSLRVDLETGLVVYWNFSDEKPNENGWESLFDRSIGTLAAEQRARASLPAESLWEQRERLKKTLSSTGLAAYAEAAFFKPNGIVDDSEKEATWQLGGLFALSHPQPENHPQRATINSQVPSEWSKAEIVRVKSALVLHKNLASNATVSGSASQFADSRLINVRGATVRRGKNNKGRGNDSSAQASSIWERLEPFGLTVRTSRHSTAALPTIESPKSSKEEDFERYNRDRARLVARISRSLPGAASMLRNPPNENDFADDSFDGLQREAKFIAPDKIDEAVNWKVGGETYWLIHRNGGEGAGTRYWLFLLHGAPGKAAKLVDLTHRLRYKVGRKPSGLGDDGKIERSGSRGADDFGFGSWPSSVDSVKVAYDRYLIATGFWTEEERRWVLLFDLKTDEIKFFERDLPEAKLLADFALSEDGRTLVQAGSNGHLFLYDLASGSLALRGFDVDDELILYDQRGYYAATPEGAQFVYLKFPGLPGYNSFQQFARVLNRPDLIRAMLQGKADTADPRLTPPPTVTLDEDIEKVGGNRSARLKLAATSSVGLEKIRVFVDGRLANEYPATGQSATIAATIALQPEARWVTAVAVDRAGFESVPRGRGLAEATDAISSRLFAIAVGTDRYDDPGIRSLNVAKADAVNFAKSLEALRGLAYGDVNVTSFLDANELRATLPARIREVVSKASERDTIMLFAAAHGDRDPASGEFLLITRDSRLDNLAETSIGWKEIAGALDGAKARVVVFLDACHAGAAASGTNDDAVSTLLHGKSSIVVIAASKGRQLSNESETGGDFTTAVVRAFSTDRQTTDSNGNGAIELAELYGTVKREVVSVTDGKQTPWIARNQMVGETPLF